MTFLDGVKRRLGPMVGGPPHQRMVRALVKTGVYRVLMVVVTVAVAFLITGNRSEALSIGVAANALTTAMYYGYERVWDRISWGLTTGT